MHISLPLHIAIHFIIAVLAGLAVGFYFKKPWLGIIAGVMGGFLIDLDHVLEYFFIFGPHFDLSYFMEGRQFLISNKIILIFHAWEYIPILLGVAWLLRRRKNVSIFLLALTFGGIVHLVSDSFLNNYPPRNYSIVYRASNDFSASVLLNSEQQRWYDELRQELGL
ncbi:MAG: hypothetical protein WC719_03090 [Patescibacteria group bacterium]|jgi:hypothetical protein